jgi:CheY-like chemotaxis protein
MDGGVMATAGTPVVLLMADDDPDDVLLTREALEESRIVNDFYSVADGNELLAYLRHEGSFSESSAPRPDLILLDLNMPRKDGRQALIEIKADPLLRMIPVVVLTTSNADEDIDKAYSSGAASYIQKPVTFQGMVKVMQSLGTYWFQIVTLP